MCKHHDSRCDRLHQFLDSTTYRSLHDSHPDGVSVFNVHGGLVTVNTQMQALTGYSRDELLSLDWNQFIVPSDIHTAQTRFWECLEGRCTRYELGLLSKTNERIDLEVSLYPIEVHGTVCGVYSVFKDIRSVKRMERSLVKSRRLLQQAQRMARIGMWELDPVNWTFRWSREVFEMFGRPFQDTVDYDQIIEYIHPDDRDDFIARISTLVAERCAGDLEYRICRPDGQERVLHCNLDDGMDGELMGTVQDITVWKEAERMVRQAEKLSAVGQLAAGVAHEIRNPLTALRGFLQLLEQSLQAFPSLHHLLRQKRYVGIMKSELARIEMIVNELLVFAKPQTVRFAEAPLDDLLADVVTLLNPQAIVRNVTVQLCFAKPAPSIECDPNQLKQLFVNLVKNALEAMPSGGVIIIGMIIGKDRVTISIEDDGEGISPEALPRLTEPFFSTKPNGTGLGLMVCQRIVEAHFGNMTIESQVGVGTRIAIELPVFHRQHRDSPPGETSPIALER